MRSEEWIDRQDRYCVIGAGPSGLAAAKNLLEQGIECDILERHSAIGGIWDIDNPHSTVYDTTYTITSKKVTAYTDFPFSERDPSYLHHRRVLGYLRDYAARFDLIARTRCNAEVTRVERQGECWDVFLASGECLRYQGLIVANGHNWKPKLPNVAGEFRGQSFHSSAYRNPEGLAGKRVLVVGAGNTGCDIAVEASHTAAATHISMRRGYYFVPKFIFGIPADELGQRSQSSLVPLAVVRFFYRLLLRLTVGKPEHYGLPAPDHALLESPPIVNSLLPYYVAHGRVQVRPDMARIDGRHVVFTDGRHETYDVIIHATGYEIVFPFIDRRHLNWKDGRPDFYMMCFHPEYDNFFIAGLTDGTGGHFPTVDLQTRVIAGYIAALRNKAPAAAVLKEKKRNGNIDFSKGIRFIRSSRSLTQFELATFTAHMRRWIRQLSPA